MEKGQETWAKSLLQEFIADSVPDYLLDGAHCIVSNAGIQKFSLKQREQCWDVKASIQGEDFQIYSSELFLDLCKEGQIGFNCNCPDSFSGICRHVGATALKLLASLETNTESKTNKNEKLPAKPKIDWRQTFRGFFATELDPEPGQHYLVFRFFPEPRRMLVSFHRARQNKSGLSTVQAAITLEQIINNPDWSELSSALPKVAEQIACYIDYTGHKVEVPNGLLTWLFRSIRNEYYLFWRDTDQPCRVHVKTMRLMLKPQLTDKGLSLDVMLARDGKLPFSIHGQQAYFYGQLPLWVYWKKNFYPVQTDLDAQLIQDLSQQQPIIPHNEISEFLDRVWTRLPASNLTDQEAFLEQMQPIFIPATFNPKLFLGEEGSLLTLQIQNVYDTEHGEIILPGPNPDLQTGSFQHEGRACLIRHDREAEGRLTQQLLELNFQLRSFSMWFLEPEEAIVFLLDAYPKLVETYRIYGEKNLTRYKVRLSQPVIIAELESKKEGGWFNLELAAKYDDQQVSIDKIWKAWTQGKRYVQLKDGSYTSLPGPWLEKLAHKLRAMGLDPNKPPKKQFKQFEAPILDKILDDIPGVKVDGFWSKLRTKIHNFTEITHLTVPKGLNTTLRPYQLHGLAFLNFLREYGFGGILADEMGLGKTIQTLAFLLHLLEQGQRGPSLIVVPTSVLHNWERECQKFTPQIKQLIIYGTRREGMFKKIKDSDLVVTTYALLRRDLEELQKFEFNALILDEAQNIKNPNTITARSIRKLTAKLRVCLSGTPIENNLFELWSLFEFLMPGFLSSQHAFQCGIVKPIKDGDQETLDYLRARVKPFILRRTKAEVARDLPPKVENIYYCGLMDEQMELYAALAKKLKEQVLSTVDEKGLAKSQMSILDALLKLRQICCHPRLLKLDMPGVSTNLPSGKFNAFKDMITDIIDEGHKVLVFSQFVSMLHIIRSWLTITEVPFAYLDGASKDRPEQVDRFNNDPCIPIFLISLKAGGTGLNLTGADYVIHYDPWWNPAVESQATDRTHRIGQTRQVFSYKLICQNTVEEKILKLQERKRDVAEAIIPGHDTWKSLTRTELEMLFEI
ncbi:ATP-dependent helicase [Desulfovibrionales bacterium]